MPKFPLPGFSSCLILVLAPAIPACANGQTLLKPQSIRVDGTQQYTSDEIGEAAGIKPRQTYTVDFLNQTAQKLMATGLFGSVGFKFDGQDLVYLITDSPDLYPVVIDNVPLPPGEDFEADLRSKVPLYHGKVPSEGTTLDGVRQELQSALAQEGLQATVVSVPAGNDAGKKATAMKFRIDAPPVRVGDIHLDGVSAAETNDLQPAIQKLNFEYDPHAAGRIESALATVYQDHGYAAVKVQATRSGPPVGTNDSIRVPFNVRVEEGEKYRLGTVQLGPSIPFTLDDLAKMMPPRERFVPENRYASAVRSRVEARLKSKGYLDCSVTSSPSLDQSTGVVNYTIDAVTGPVYHLGLLKFENVSDALRALLMRNWQIMPGEPFDETYVSNFILIAQKSDPVLQRSLAGVKTSYDVHADPQTRDVNVIIRLERQ